MNQTEEDKEKELEQVRKVIIPMIRQIVPGMIAQQITGVQPMSTERRDKIPYETGISREVDGDVEFYWVKPSQPDPGMYLFSTTFSKAKKRNEEIDAWCYATFGPRGTWGVDLVNPNARWHASDQKYYFRNEADRTLFVLRWE
jgi:hypothetical protein